MTNLPINLETFGFVQREKHDGITVRNKCGRDFLYYALHYLLPEKFNPNLNNPVQIDSSNLFGINFKGRLSILFAWTQLQFYKMPIFLKSLGIHLEINKVKISSFWKLVQALLFSRINYIEAIKLIQNNVDDGKVTGVDLALKYGGLLDHIMFVYGYDEENLYIFDTNKIPNLEYVKMTEDDRFYMRLSKAVIKQRWKRWSRVWIVENETR